MQQAEKRFGENNVLEVINNEELKTLQEYLINIQIVGEYNDDDSPLDSFDSECHD